MSRSQFPSRSRNKAGISEVISTIILITATVVIGFVALIWANSSSVNSQNNLGAVYQNDMNSEAEKFVITYISFSGSNSIIGMINTGTINTRVCSIAVTDLQTKNTFASPYTNGTWTKTSPAPCVTATTGGLIKSYGWSLPQGMG